MHPLTFNLFFCIIISLTSAKKVIVVSPEIINRVRPITEQCIKESGSNPNSLKDLLEWNFQDNPANKKFVYCFCSKSGLIDETAHIVINKFLELIPDDNIMDQKEDYVNMLNECNKITGEDVIEKVYQMGICFNQKSSFSFTL